jgi:tryptophan synthase alpha chain
VNRIDDKFRELATYRRKALMPYITMGYPDENSALSIVPALVAGGADLVELGVPFSDPLADGATIQAASQHALDNGITLDICLRQSAELRGNGISLPFVMMGYYNPIMQYGISEFASASAASGIDGVIVPDLPPEEAHPLLEALNVNGIHTIFLLAPTSSPERISTVVELSDGFIYMVSLVGVTGERKVVSPGLASFVQRVRQVTNKPLAVGFGISTPNQAAEVSSIADGIIVGSALVKAITGVSNPAEAAYIFIGSLRCGIDNSIEGQKGV